MAYGKVIQGERDKLVKRIWRTEARSGKKFLTKGTRDYSTQELRDIDKESREKYPTKQEKAKQEKAKQGKPKKINPRKYFTRKALEAGKRYEKMTGKKVPGGLYVYDENGRKRIRKAEEILASIQNAEKVAYKKKKPLTRKEMIEGIKKKEPYFDDNAVQTDYIRALYASYYPEKPEQSKTFVSYGKNQGQFNLFSQMNEEFTIAGMDNNRELIYRALTGSVANFVDLYNEYYGNIRTTFEQQYGNISIVDFMGAKLYDYVMGLTDEQAKNCVNKLASNAVPQYVRTSSDGIYEFLSGKENPTILDALIIYKDWLTVMGG